MRLGQKCDWNLTLYDDGEKKEEKEEKKRRKEEKKRETIQKQRFMLKDIETERCLCMIEHCSGEFNAC